MKESVVHLQGNTSDLIIQTHPVVEILYWGDKISGGKYAAFRRKTCGTEWSFDVDTPATITPEHGRGVFSSPVWEGNRQGLDWSPCIRIQAIQQDGNHLLITDRRSIAGLKWFVSWKLDSQTGMSRRFVTR